MFRRTLVTSLLLCAAGAMPGHAQSLIGATRFYKVVTEGGTVQIDHYASLDPLCHSLGATQVNLLTEPKGGHVMTRLGSAFPAYPPNNPRVACVKRRLPSTLVLYRADTGYTGSDVFDVEAVYPDGVARKYRYLVFVR